MIEKRRGASPQSICRAESNPGPETWRCLVGDREGTAKKLCDTDVAERSGELSGGICLETLVFLGNDREPP